MAKAGQEQSTRLEHRDIKLNSVRKAARRCAGRRQKPSMLAASTSCIRRIASAGGRAVVEELGGR